MALPQAQIQNSIPSDAHVSPRGGRGRGAQQRNQDKFRAKKGAEQNAANRKRIEEKCFYKLTELSAELTKIDVRQSPVAKQLPVTTRGIGFVCNEVFQKAQDRVPDTCSIYTLYRATLAQFELQVQQTSKSSKEQSTYPLPLKNDCNLFRNSKDVIFSRPRNFFPLSSIINSFGHFNVFNSAYHPYVPLSMIKNYSLIVGVRAHPVIGAGGVPIVDQVLVDQEQNAFREVPRQNYEADAAIHLDRGFLPDPYTTVLSNLRRTVTRLADLQTPGWVRNFFYYRNPIPGAIWMESNDGWILTNANDIIPENYGESMLKQDLMALQNWLAKFKGKVPYADGLCDFTGKGTSSQIVSCKIEAQLKGNRLEIKDETYGTPEGLVDSQFLLGVLTQFGEFPDSYEPLFDLLISPPSVYSPRHHANNSHLLPVSWDNVMQAALN